MLQLGCDAFSADMKDDHTCWISDMNKFYFIFFAFRLKSSTLCFLGSSCLHDDQPPTKKKRISLKNSCLKEDIDHESYVHADPLFAMYVDKELLGAEATGLMLKRREQENLGPSLLLRPMQN